MIGFIDWTEGKVSLRLFEKKDGRFSCSDTVSVTYDGELRSSLLSQLAKPGISRTYLSVPASFLSIRELSFPFSDPEKIRETLPYELEDKVLGSVHDYSFDHFLAVSSENERDVVAVFIAKKRLKEIIDLFSSAGLEPAVITSVDIRILENDLSAIMERPSFDEETRVRAASEELLVPKINLRQGEYSYTGDIDRLTRSFRITGALVVLFFLILASFSIGKLVKLKDENVFLNKEITGLYRSSFPGEARIVDVSRQFRGNLISLKARKEVLAGIPLLDTLLGITAAVPDDITLNELIAEHDTVLIKGSAPSFETVDSLKNTLEDSFDDVRILDSKSSLDKKIGFSISMKEKTS